VVQMIDNVNAGKMRGVLTLPIPSVETEARKVNSDPFDALGYGPFILLIGCSFLGVFLSLIPGVIQQFNAGEKPNWQIATGIFCTIASIALISVVLLFKRNNLFGHPDFSMRFMVTVGCIVSTFILGAGLSALGVYFEATMGIYMVGLMCLMFISASMFGLLIKFILRGVRDEQ
jgi:hypothetical protein